MKRLSYLLGCLALVACRGVDLSDYPRAFACDHNGGDGGECAAGWACGFDDRCFPRNLRLDGGQRVDLWRCMSNVHCPEGWQCGQEFDSLRYCQQLGVGAPSPCLDNDGGCEGGWRCAAAHRCFDPADTDGGTERDCTSDAQCPDDFRCGELVEGGLAQRCIQLGVGAPSICATDDGCEGGFRCDTFAHRCVEVTDVLTAGRTAQLGAREWNPRQREPAPLMIAATRPGRMYSLIDGWSLQPRDGVMFASLFADGRLRVTVQLYEEQDVDGGRVMMQEKTWTVPGGAAAEVTDLAVSTEGPAVRFRDGGAARLRLDAGTWEDLGRTDFLRQRDLLDGPGGTLLVQVAGSTVSVEGRAAVSFPGIVREVVANRDTLFAATSTGFFVSPAPDGGPVHDLTQGTNGPIMLNSPSRGAVAGLLSSAPGMPPALGIIAEVLRPGGATGVATLTEGAMEWSSTPPAAACPDGGSPLQLGFDEETTLRSMLIARCASGDGGSFPVQVRFRGPTPDFGSVIEDQIPYQGSFVTQRSAPFVRAHGASNGRLWHALDPDGRGLLGRLALRPVLLDRQPETMLSFSPEPGKGARVFLEAGGFIFSDALNGGFVSQLNLGPAATPLSAITNHSDWILMNVGVLQATTGQQRLIATMPAGQTLAAPGSGVLVPLMLGGRSKDVIIVASGDTIWVADVTDAQTGPFAQPAVFQPVLVPVPGVRLRSMTLEASDGGISGYLTTSTQNVHFSTQDLVRWPLRPVAAPELDSLPLEVWSEPDGGPGRTGYADGRIWSLPIMVPLTRALTGRDGGALSVTDFGRKCGDVFAATSEGLFRAEPSVADGGLPAWTPVSLPVALDSTESLRLYETSADVERLFIGTQTGQVVELTATCR